MVIAIFINWLLVMESPNLYLKSKYKIVQQKGQHEFEFE